ncbi:MAG: DUF615 domain-containing protein [Deltaproteobacteria bacterium]|nr:MAG: DUF615 domain-containing protein [Deltaproteobacteria bacterium]
MAKKRKQTFGWVAEGVEGEVRELVERPNRSAIKRHRARVAQQAERLAQLSPAQRAPLGLDEAQEEALRALARASKSTDRRRKLLHATRLLLDADLDALEAFR